MSVLKLACPNSYQGPINGSHDPEAWSDIELHKVSSSQMVPIRGAASCPPPILWWLLTTFSLDDMRDSWASKWDYTSTLYDGSGPPMTQWASQDDLPQAEDPILPGRSARRGRTKQSYGLTYWRLIQNNSAGKMSAKLINRTRWTPTQLLPSAVCVVPRLAAVPPGSTRPPFIMSYIRRRAA